MTDKSKRALEQELRRSAFPCSEETTAGLTIHQYVATQVLSGLLADTSLPRYKPREGDVSIEDSFIEASVKLSAKLIATLEIFDINDL